MNSVYKFSPWVRIKPALMKNVRKSERKTDKWRAVSKVSRFELRSKVLIYQAPSYNESQAPVVATSQKPRFRKWWNISSFFMLLVLIMSLITIGSLTLNKIVSITKLRHLVYKKILDKFEIAWKIRSARKISKRHDPSREPQVECYPGFKNDTCYWPKNTVRHDFVGFDRLGIYSS